LNDKTLAGCECASRITAKAQSGGESFVGHMAALRQPTGGNRAKLLRRAIQLDGPERRGNELAWVERLCGEFSGRSQNP